MTHPASTRFREAVGVDPGPELVIVRLRRGRSGAGERLTAAELAHVPPAVPVLSVLAAREAVIQRIKAPFPSVRKARRVWPTLLDVEIPFPVESCRTAFIDAARTPGGSVEVLAAACRTNALEDRLRHWNERGIDPAAVESELPVLWESSLRIDPAAPGLRRAAVYAGPDRVSVALGSGGRIESGAAFDAEILPEAAVDRIEQRCRGLWGMADLGGAVITLTGPALVDPALRDRWREAAERTGARCVAAERPVTDLAETAARRMLDGCAAGGNLRTGPLEHPLWRRRRDARRLHRAATLLAAGLALCAANALWARAVEGARLRIDRARDRAAAAVIGGAAAPRGQEVWFARGEADRGAAGRTRLERYWEPTAARLLRDVLAAATEAGSTLEQASLRENELILRGAAVDWEAPDALLDAARSHGWDGRIERQDAGRTEQVFFVLRVRRPA
jgi:hypothetical protein